MKIIKRDGRQVPFDKQKIINAIFGAFKEVDGELSDYAVAKAHNIADYIYNNEKDILSVEEVQDLVVHGLMSTKRKDVAEAYVVYRHERTKERNKNSELTKEVGKKLRASDVQNQNANVDEHSFGGRRGEAANVVMKDFALNYRMSKMARDNHINNEVYTHDLDSYELGMHNCLSLPLDPLLANGFNTRQTSIRPANSASTAFQLMAVLSQLQSLQQFGGVSATHLDWTMVPYVRKSFYKHYFDGMKHIGGLDENELKCQKEYDMNFNPIEVSIKDIDKYKHEEEYKYALDMTERELKQAVEGMYHNLK